MRAESHGHTSKCFAIQSKANWPKAHKKSITLLGYRFKFIQSLIPENEHGHAIKFYPQESYKHRHHKRLLKHGTGAFCRFSIEAGEAAGVYMLVCNGEVLYIGETCNVRQRFNNRGYGSYGFITPAACYEGGQSTNCKINHLVLAQFEAGQPLQLYFMQFDEHKRIERELLQHVTTPYNVKDN